MVALLNDNSDRNHGYGGVFYGEFLSRAGDMLSAPPGARFTGIEVYALIDVVARWRGVCVPVSKFTPIEVGFFESCSDRDLVRKSVSFLTWGDADGVGVAENLNRAETCLRVLAGRVMEMEFVDETS
jgi:hypothetical protein